MKRILMGKNKMFTGKKIGKEFRTLKVTTPKSLYPDFKTNL